MRFKEAIMFRVVAALLLFSGPALAGGVPVDISAPDGFGLKASYWAAEAPGPGVLLFHQCNMDRHSYDALAEELQAAGFHVLSLDFRGFGESTDENVRSFREQYEELLPLWDGDVDRTIEFLAAMPDVDGERIGALGASCGGSQALLLATRNDAVKTIVFLSSSIPGWKRRTSPPSRRTGRSRFSASRARTTAARRRRPGASSAARATRTRGSCSTRATRTGYRSSTRIRD